MMVAKNLWEAKMGRKQLEEASKGEVLSTCEE